MTDQQNSKTHTSFEFYICSNLQDRHHFICFTHCFQRRQTSGDFLSSVFQRPIDGINIFWSNRRASLLRCFSHCSQFASLLTSMEVIFTEELPPKSVAIVYGWHTRVFSITYFFRGKQNTIENMIRIPTVCISASDFVTHILTKKKCAASVGIMYDGEHKPSPVANANASKIVFAMHTIIRSSTPLGS